VKDPKASPEKSSPSRQRWWKYLPRRRAVEELPLLPVRTAEEKEAEECESNPESEKPFELTDIALRIPKGSFVAIVGRVGSGKVCLRDVHL
jgi:ABC-type bacteriocin/lantibiotic exporter with double-glycine peptidase domain